LPSVARGVLEKQVLSAPSARDKFWDQPARYMAVCWARVDQAAHRAQQRDANERRALDRGLWDVVFRRCVPPAQAALVQALRFQEGWLSEADVLRNLWEDEADPRGRLERNARSFRRQYGPDWRSIFKPDRATPRAKLRNRLRQLQYATNKTLRRFKLGT